MSNRNAQPLARRTCVFRRRLALILSLSFHVSITCSTQKYLECLKGSKDVHHICRDLSRDYLQCRMDHQLMSKENLDHVRHVTPEQYSLLADLLSLGG